MERFLKSRYKIGEKISENPFSVTYKGSFLASNKPLIIKIYKRGTLNSRLINQMKRKVKELSLVNHHGVAKLIDGDYGWQGFYYVRDFVEGKSLQQILENGQEIGVERARIIAEEACRALEVVHGKGIIHGGIKPSNIFLDKKGVVKLTDFVIEGEIKESMPQKVLSIMNNGKYTSPEEIAGQAAAPSSDIYALGLVLFEMMTAQGLNIKEGLPGGLNKLRQAALFDKEVLARLPKYLQDIVVKSVQPDPFLRFTTITELRQCLENKTLIADDLPQQEFIKIFDNTVTQYGGEEITRESETLQDVGRVRIRWGKEKHRNWILGLILGAALISGMVYAFLFGR